MDGQDPRQQIEQLLGLILAATASPPPRWLSEEQAADTLGIDRKTLRRLIDDGKVPVFNGGRGTRRRNWRINPLDLAKLAKPVEKSKPPVVSHRPRRRRTLATGGAGSVW